jgi:protein-disulfide isomerase
MGPRPRTYNSGVKAVQLNRVLIFLGFVGIFIAGVLSLAHFQHLVPPCGATSSSCDKVTNDRSSIWFGVPVAYIGLGSYIVLTILAVLRAVGDTSLFKKTTVLSYILAVGGALISIGLQFYSFMVIQALCKWCLASAITMTLTLVVTAFMYQEVSEKPVERPAARNFDFMFASALVVVLVLSLFGGEAMLKNSGIKATVIDIPKSITLIPDKPNLYGDANAPVTIVEFADLNCPSCQANSPLIKEFVREHEGKVRLIYRHFPLPIHKTSAIAAAIDEYAAEKGKFWEYTLAVMGTKKEDNSAEDLFAIAGSLNMDVSDIKKRLANDADPIYKRLTDDENTANGIGVAATPTFIVLAPGLKPTVFGPSELKDAMNRPPYEKFFGGSS